MRNLLRKKLRNQKGFTLIELLAVIVILGIIASIAVPAIGNIIDNSKKDAHIANAQQVLSAAKLYVIGENVSTDLTNQVPTGYISDIINPWTNVPYETTAAFSYTVSDGVITVTLTGTNALPVISDMTEAQLRTLTR